MQACGHLYCFDWQETNFDLFGSEASGLDFAAMDPTLTPCASEVTLHDGSIVGGGDECEWDKEEVMKKMGSAYNFMTYFNVEEFMKDQYGEDRVERKAVLSAKFTVSNKAVWTEAWVEYNELVDEVDLFQLGQQM